MWSLLSHAYLQVPVMLATDWSQASQSHLQKAIKSLKRNGYQVIVRNDMLSKERLQMPIGREESALVSLAEGGRARAQTNAVAFWEARACRMCLLRFTSTSVLCRSTTTWGCGVTSL